MVWSAAKELSLNCTTIEFYIGNFSGNNANTQLISNQAILPATDNFTHRAADRCTVNYG